jgi:hypothetical protein
MEGKVTAEAVFEEILNDIRELDATAMTAGSGSQATFQGNVRKVELKMDVARSLAGMEMAVAAATGRY